MLLSYLKAYHLYYYFALVRFAKGRSLDLHSINLLQEDFYHEGKKILDTFGRMVNKIKEEGVNEDSRVFLIQTFQKFESKYTHYHDRFFRVAPNLKSAFELHLSITKLSHILSQLVSRKNGTKFADQIEQELSLVQESLKHIFKVEFDTLFVTLEDTLKNAVENVRQEKKDILNKLKIKLVEDYEKSSKVLKFSYSQAELWTKIFTNLIRNGVEAVEQKLPATSYSLQAGVVRVVMGGKGDEVWVVVEDNGIGMTEEVKNNFYKRGFTHGKSEGLGLGITENTIDFISKAGELQIKTEVNKGTEFLIKMHPQKLEHAIFENENVIQNILKSQALRAFGFSLILLTLMLGIILLNSLRWSDAKNPVIVEPLSDFSIAMKNEKGKILKTMVFSQPLSIWRNIGSGTIKKFLCKLVDLDGDSKNEVLIGERFTEQSTGKVICLNHKGKELWHFDCGAPGIYNVSLDEYSPNGNIFSPNDIEAEDLDNDGKKEVLITSMVDLYFVNQLVILDNCGLKLREFWHPGGIDDIQVLDYDLDGKKECIIRGINNRYWWRPIVGFYDTEKVDGQAFPYCSIKGLPKAEAEVYLVLPNIKKNLPQEDSWVNYMSSNHNFKCEPLETGGYNYEIFLNDSRVYKLDSNFNLLGKVGFFPTGFKTWSEENHFKYFLSNEDKENWKEIEVWINGVKRKSYVKN